MKKMTNIMERLIHLMNNNKFMNQSKQSDKDFSHTQSLNNKSSVNWSSLYSLALILLRFTCQFYTARVEVFKKGSVPFGTSPFFLMWHCPLYRSKPCYIILHIRWF